jgi:hypothetical protein
MGYLHPFGLSVSRQIPKVETLDSEKILYLMFRNRIHRIPGGLGYFHPFGLPVSRQIPEAETLDGACEGLKLKNDR